MPRPLQYQEIVLHQIMSLHILQPHYFSSLFHIATQLLDEDEILEMERRIGLVEMMVNGEDKYIDFDEKGNSVVRARPKGGLTLYDIEMALESNLDYYAYFEREDGVKITKFDVERELDKVKRYIFLRVKEKAYGMRFTRM
ncbi:hypothetical protein GOV11_03510 [Candidatus Woesearchaeota archaeon]|nr:hypothetical protein [Candidatus Woesearchaeota archaeon]